MSETKNCAANAAGDSCIVETQQLNLPADKLKDTSVHETTINDENKCKQLQAAIVTDHQTAMAVSKNETIASKAAGDHGLKEISKNSEGNVGIQFVPPKTTLEDIKQLAALTEKPICQEKEGQSNNINDKIAMNDENVNKLAQNSLTKLEEELKERTEERNNYRKKLEETEKKLSDLQTWYKTITSGDSDEAKLHRTMEQLRTKLMQTTLQLEDRGRVVVNQENQINALNNQVTSLKEVVAITRDLLQIRNMEVKHLQHEIDDMENRISQEHERHNTMLTKMDAAVRLNADLKKEYETQLTLFQDLRQKYEEKVTLLSTEKEALELTIQQSATK